MWLATRALNKQWNLSRILRPQLMMIRSRPFFTSISYSRPYSFDSDETMTPKELS